METKRIYFLKKVLMELRLAAGSGSRLVRAGLGLEIMRHDAIQENTDEPESAGP